MGSISLKALIDKEQNRVIFAESYEDFIDVLFSFLTMPMGSIVKLTRDTPPGANIGSMTNLYASMESLDVKHLRDEACKTMLLNPQNAAAAQCKNLKIIINDGEPRLRSFLWVTEDSLTSVSCFGHHGGHNNMKELNEHELKNDVFFDARDGGVFVKGLTRHLITDDLQVIPPSTKDVVSLLDKLAVKHVSSIEERTFSIGKHEVLRLLKSSLESKMPFTETLLESKPPVSDKLSNEIFVEGSSIKHELKESESTGCGKICEVRLMVSKSKKRVCYAEAGEDFVDLLFSFLIIPLGYVLKHKQCGPQNGCIHHLYKSAQDLDADKFLKSNDHLLNPKIAPGFGYKNWLLNVEEVSEKEYHYAHWTSGYYSSTPSSSGKNLQKASILTVMDPKSPYRKADISEGFLIGPAKFTVTDDLKVTPISPVFGMSSLNKSTTLFDDIEERVVHVGYKEAFRLLVASFVSETTLTDAFLLGEANKDV